MSAVGIIIVKEHSNRFPGKNYYFHNGAPMFYHNVELLLNCDKIDDVYVCTDSDYSWLYSYERNIKTIWRGKNISADEQPFFEVLKYAYQSIPERYDYIVAILANCIGHKQDDVNTAVETAIENNYHDVRSFNDSGRESGIIILKESVLINNFNISAHMGAVRSNGREIHYRSELDEQ